MYVPLYPDNVGNVVFKQNTEILQSWVGVGVGGIGVTVGVGDNVGVGPIKHAIQSP